MAPVRIALALVLVICVGFFRSVRAEVAVSAIDPPRPSSGQVVLILADAFGGTETDIRVEVEQDGDTSEAFVFPNATLPDAIYARLPNGLRSGPAALSVVFGDDAPGDPFQFEVGDQAAAPAVWAVYPYGTGGEPVESLETVRPGDRLLLFGAGMDTTGVTVILRYANGVEEIAPSFAHTSTAVGVAPVFDLPSDLPAGPVRLSTRVSVCEPLEACVVSSSSSESEAIGVTVN